ncbi:MAG TPA: hypothetical protein VFD70_15550 [Anaerolineae bacterium]|nr:hypothetical protein [Anaerolineae bacterium]
MMRRIIFVIVGMMLVSACAPANEVTPAPTDVATSAQGSSAGVKAQASVVPTVQAETAVATLAPTVSLSPTREAAARLFQLMEGGCCVSPMWSVDSEAVLFIDKPNADAPTGIYQVKLDAPKQETLWNERIAFYTRELDYAQIPEPAGTRLIRVSDGSEVRIKNGGRQVQLSPDRTRIVWSESRDTYPIENRVTNIVVANMDGTNPKQVTQILRGGVNGWLDNNRLLLNGRASRDTEDTTVFVYDLRDGSRTEIVRAVRLRLTSASRDGSWIAYVITNDDDAARNGLWVVRSDGTGAKKLDFFGGLQWRDGSHFIYTPFEMYAPSHAFVEYDAESGASRRLTPESQPFKIASGDWAVSPDGKKIVFVNAADNNLWVWEFTP